jgi:hypothetical protein
VLYVGKTSDSMKTLTYSAGTIRRIDRAVVIAAVWCLAALAPAFAQSQPPAQSWDRTPVRPAQTSDVNLASLRQKRAKSFNSAIPMPLDGPPMVVNGTEVKTGSGYAMDPAPMPPLPVNESSTILVGTFKDHQTYFSGDHSKIVSELDVQVEKILMDHSGIANADTSVTVMTIGGTLKRADGRVFSVGAPLPPGILSVGHRYVFFLEADKSTQSFGLIKVWELGSDAKVIPLHVFDTYAAAYGLLTLPSDEASFLNTLNAEIALRAR